MPATMAGWAPAIARVTPTQRPDESLVTRARRATAAPASQRVMPRRRTPTVTFPVAILAASPAVYWVTPSTSADAPAPVTTVFELLRMTARNCTRLATVALASTR